MRKAHTLALPYHQLEEIPAQDVTCPKSLIFKNIEWQKSPIGISLLNRPTTQSKQRRIRLLAMHKLETYTSRHCLR